MKKFFNYKREEKQNPFIGFTIFQHFSSDELYSDLVVKPENNMTETEHVECYPVPAYVEQKGKEQGYYPDCSVIYIRILWKEFEPLENQYNYSFIEDILSRAKHNRKSVMFRLMQHSTRESDDVPEWLKQKIECPARPVGMRVKDCPRDPRFLKYFGRAVRAFGERFDSNPTLEFMDISLPGAWGEGSHIDLFTQEQLKEYVDIYTDVFKNTLLIGQTCIPWLVHHSNEKTSMGWRADCIGRPNLTYEMLPPKVEKMGDIWKRGHVSFEAYWWLGEWKRQGWDIDKILSTLLEWHISTFNAKSLPIPWEWKDKIDGFIAKMGYHFMINYAEYCGSVKYGEEFTLKIEMENVGVAPIYHRIPFIIRIKNEKVEQVIDTDTDITKWLPGRHIITTQIMPKDAGRYNIEIAIKDSNYTLCLCTDAESDGQYYKLGEIEVKN